MEKSVKFHWVSHKIFSLEKQNTLINYVYANAKCLIMNLFFVNKNNDNLLNCMKNKYHQIIMRIYIKIL